MKIINPSRDVFNNLQRDSKKMYSLMSLHFSVEFTRHQEGDEIDHVAEIQFFEESDFPSLKSFSYLSMFNFGTNWDTCERFFGKLDNLKITTSKKCEDSSFKNMVFFSKDDLLKNLKDLELRKVRFEEEFESHLPSLENLKMFKCRNIIIIPGNNIKYLFIESVERHHLTKVFENSQNVKELILRNHTSDPPDCWFLDPSINSYRKLKSIRLGNFKFTNTDVKRWDRLKPQFEFISFDQAIFNKVATDVFNRSQYPSLKILKLKLSLSVVSKVGNIWPFSKTLNTLVISNSIDDIFQNNEFPVLERLIIRSSRRSLLRGRNWKKFPRLRKLRLLNTWGIKDDFFENLGEGIIQLKHLEIHNLPQVYGKKWDPRVLDTLEFLRISKCKNISDIFFQDNVFGNLKTLELKELDDVLGFGWKKMEELKDLKVIFCPFFNEDGVKEYDDLRIDVCV